MICISAAVLQEPALKLYKKRACLVVVQIPDAVRFLLVTQWFLCGCMSLQQDTVMRHITRELIAKVTFANPACYYIFDSLIISMSLGQRLG